MYVVRPPVCRPLSTLTSRSPTALPRHAVKIIPRQLFEVPIQAAVGTTIIARRTLSALRADVTAGLYGGHYERKLKHLNNQKESKRKMKRVGKIDLPQEAFFDLLSTK